MAKLKTYSEFVNEGIMDVLKSPIKYVKIKNNAKKLVKAKVAVALNDVNFEKKKQKSKETGTGDNKVLTAANAAKNAALKDVAKGVSDRMDTLASSPILKKVSSLAKAKAALAANKTILKGADGEEAKQLKIKQTELTKKATELASGIKDFESTAAKKKETPAAKEAPVTKDDAKKKAAAEETPDTTEETPVTKDDGSAKIEADIKAYNKSIEDERASMTKSMKDLDAAKRDQKLGRVSDEQVQAIMKRIEDSKEDIIELKKKEGDAKKKLSAKVPESFEYVAESVSEKFSRLRKDI